MDAISAKIIVVCSVCTNPYQRKRDYNGDQPKCPACLRLEYAKPKCKRCYSRDNVTSAPDPFKSTIYHDMKHVLLCNECREESESDILYLMEN